MFKILLTFLSFIIAFSANAQKITLQSKNDCYIAACCHPKNGFVLKEKPIIIKTNNDRFIINFTSGIFTWQDNKGSNSYKMYNITHSENNVVHIFNTEYHTVRYKINSNGINSVEIISLINANWYNSLFLCTLQ